MTAVNWASPNAELVLRVQPPKPKRKTPEAKAVSDAWITEWLTMRRQGLGGTDAATIMGANKFTYLHQMWADKTDAEPPINAQSDILRFGHDMEPKIVDWFTEDTGLTVRRVGTLRSKSHPFMQANIDGLTSDGGILEIKTTEWFTESGKEWNGGDIPDHPWWQVQHCLAVSGRSHGWFAALVGRKLHIPPRIERDEEAIERLIAAEQAFWETHVIPNVAPPVDLAAITAEEALARYPRATAAQTVAIDDQPIPDVWIDNLTDFLTARDVEAAAKKTKEAAKAKLMTLIGDKELLTLGGMPVIKWGQTSGASYLDADEVIERLAEHEGKTPFEIRREHTKKRADTRSLTVVKQKMEKAA